MDIDWQALVKVALISFAFGVGIVSVFSLGIVGMAATPGDESSSPTGGEGAGIGSRTVGLLLAGLCFAVCAAAVLYGLWLIIPQFHD